MVFDMRFLFKMVLAPVSLFVAFLALMAKWLLTLSSYVVAPLSFLSAQLQWWRALRNSAVGSGT